MRTTTTFDRIRSNATSGAAALLSRKLPTMLATSRRASLLGIAGIGAAAGIALGPATAAHAADANPAAANPAANTAPAAPSANKIGQYDGALQPNGYYCGPAATRIALSAHGTPPTFDSLADEMGTTTDGTKSIDEITRVLNDHRGQGVYTPTHVEDKASPEQADKLRTDVIDSINHGDPVVANIAGAVTDTAGHAHRYLGGHYLTITGYTDNAKTVHVTDPADSKGSNEYDLPIDTMANWVSTRGYAS